MMFTTALSLMHPQQLQLISVCAALKLIVHCNCDPNQMSKSIWITEFQRTWKKKWRIQLSWLIEDIKIINKGLWVGCNTAWVFSISVWRQCLIWILLVWDFLFQYMKLIFSSNEFLCEHFFFNFTALAVYCYKSFICPKISRTSRTTAPGASF